MDVLTVIGVALLGYATWAALGGVALATYVGVFCTVVGLGAAWMRARGGR